MTTVNMVQHPPEYDADYVRYEKYRKHTKKSKPEKYPITHEIHLKIKAVYKGTAKKGAVNALAKKLRYPRWKISQHAQSMGWIPQTHREPNWSDAEKKILERNGHNLPETIQKKLKQAGFNRTLTAIEIKRKRMRCLQDIEGYTATSLAECLGIDYHCIKRAIEKGHLKAKKRETKQQKPNWYILPKHIRQYIIDNISEIDIRKVDKFWFVDILTNITV